MTVPARVEALSAVTLATRDMARAVRFYRALGFALNYGGEAAPFTSFVAGQAYLNLTAEAPDRRWTAPRLRPCSAASRRSGRRWRSAIERSRSVFRGPRSRATHAGWRRPTCRASRASRSGAYVGCLQ